MASPRARDLIETNILVPRNARARRTVVARAITNTTGRIRQSLVVSSRRLFYLYFERH